MSRQWKQGKGFVLVFLSSWSKLYYLIARFLASGPCTNAARILCDELENHRDLLPHMMNFQGDRVPLSMDRLTREHPDITPNYLVDLLGFLMTHLKKSGDPKRPRINALRHGDHSLFTLSSAFTSRKQTVGTNYLTMTRRQLENLSTHRFLAARQLEANVPRNIVQTACLSPFFRKRFTLRGREAPVYCLAFDKTNRRIFTGSDDCLVKVWCTRTGYLIHTIRGHCKDIADISINEENTLIATASSDGYVRVWTMDGYKPVAHLRPSTTQRPFTSVNFSPSPRGDTRYLMATNEDGIVRLWKWNRDTLTFSDPSTPILYRCKFQGNDKLMCSCFNYTGTKFAVAGDDGYVYVFSTIKVETDESSMPDTNSVNQDQDRPRGGTRRNVAPRVLFLNKNDQIHAQPVLPIAILEGHFGSVLDLAFSHDGRQILSGCVDGTARIWTCGADTRTWSSIKLDMKAELNTTVVSLSEPLSRSRGSLCDLDKVNAPTTSTTEFGSLAPPIPIEGNLNGTENITSVAMDLDSATLDMMPDEAPEPSTIAWSADDRYCIIATTHGAINVYFAYDGSPACVLKGHVGAVYALDSHPYDANTVLSAGYDGNIILWDIGHKAMIARFTHPCKVYDCRFSKDGLKFAIAGETGRCTMFGIGGLERDCAQVCSWHRGQNFYTDYSGIHVAPDGTCMDIQTGQPPHTLPPSKIIDYQGVEYANQRPCGYGRRIPICPDTFAAEDAKRAACYDTEEEVMWAAGPITLVSLDQAHVKQRRKDYVKNDEVDELEPAAAVIPALPLTSQPIWLPDDSNDEDYNDEDVGGGFDSSDSENSGAEAFIDDLDQDNFVDDGDNDSEDGPVTRSRAVQLRRSNSPDDGGAYSESSRRSSHRRGRPQGRPRGRPRQSANHARPTSHSSRSRRRKREREREDLMDDDDDVFGHPRRRRRVLPLSYAESDLEDEPEEMSEPDEDVVEKGEDESAEPISVDVSDNDIEDDDDDDDDFQAAAEAGPSTATRRTRSTTHTTPTAKTDAKGKRRLRSADEPPTTQPAQPERRRLVREAPKPRVEQKPAILSPAPWTQATTQSLSTYLPQLNDRIAILTEGHQQYWQRSEMTHLFDERHGPFESEEPVEFGVVTGVTWLVGSAAFCRLKVRLHTLENCRDALFRQTEPIWSSTYRTVTIDYSDEDGCPEFIVLWNRFVASMEIFSQLRDGQKADAIYDDDRRYSGTVSINRRGGGMPWRRVRMPSPWTYYHVVWDDTESPADDLSPWELVPAGEDFHSRYDPGTSITRQELQRAQEVIQWLSSLDDFQLYVDQVDFEAYPDYLWQIAYPISLTMIQERLQHHFYRHTEAILDDVELVRKNAQRYNDASSLAYRNAGRLANFFRSRLQNPRMPLSLVKGSRRRIQDNLSDDDEYHDDPPQSEPSEDDRGDNDVDVVPSEDESDDYIDSD